MSGTLGTLGKYQIIREIARSNDIVYEAYDPIMNRRVALKELSMPHGSTDQQREERKNRFLREARAAGTLTHPNIVTVFEYGEDQGKQFIAMEFLDGHNLRNEIDTHGFLAPDRAVEIALDVLDALEYAHNHGVIHRDIKPDNIQLLPDGRVKLTDFGIARLTFEPNLTMDGQIFGTPSYMSPEQVVGKDIDARSDLFSVAVVLFEMIAGKKPFTGDSVVSLTYSIMNSHPTQPTQMNWALWQVVEQCLEKSPQLRFANASALCEALKSAIASAKGGVMDGSNVSSVFQHTMTPYVNPTLPPPVVQHQAPIQPTQGPVPYGVPSPYQANPPYNPGQPVYTYNPYGAQTGQAYSPTGGPPPQAPDPSQYPYQSTLPPIYYPAPPRGPLFKPETMVFIRKALVTLVILGTFFGLLIAVISGTSAWLENAQRQEADKPLLSQLQQLSDATPVGERIAVVSTIHGRLNSPENKRTAKAVLGNLYLEQADEFFKLNNYAEAENAISHAVESDPFNSDILSGVAKKYEALASRFGQANLRLEYLRQSANNWRQAMTVERDPSRLEEIRNGAILAYLTLAKEYLAQGYRSESRQAAREGIDLTEGKPNQHLRALNEVLGQASF